MRWTRYQSRALIRDRYIQMRNRKAKAGVASFIDFLKLLVFLMALPFLLVALPIFGIVKLVKYIKAQKRRNGHNSEPPPFTYGNQSGQPPSPPPMTGHDFEHYCADILRHNGYTNVQVTKASGDNGVDVIAERDGIKHAVQTKFYTGTVGNDAVQQVHAGRAMYQCAVGVVMTNSTFTKSAAETAARLGIVLWDGNRLNLMAAKARATQQQLAPQAPPPQWATSQPAPPRPEIFAEKPPMPSAYQNQPPLQ